MLGCYKKTQFAFKSQVHAATKGGLVVRGLGSLHEVLSSNLIVTNVTKKKISSP